MASLLSDDSAPPPGPVQFQLVLLRRMQDFQPELVAGALRTLGVPRTAMREANRRWQGRLRARGGPAPGAARARDFAALLGPAASVTRRAHGDMRVDVHVWPLPLWPDLRFEATCGVGGVALHAWLVRAPEAEGPAPRTLADLAPWGCTAGEVARVPARGTARGLGPPARRAGLHRTGRGRGSARVHGGVRLGAAAAVDRRLSIAYRSPQRTFAGAAQSSPGRLAA